MESQDKLFGYLKKVSAELQKTRRRLRRFEAGEQEPLAIVGMGCRLPGGVESPEQFWDLIAAGTDAISAFPRDRGWEAQGADGSGADYARVGGFVYDVADFDASFFGISPREALAMDPQQRLILETSWEAVERAGIDPHSLRGSRTGVFVGANFSGYGFGLDSETGSQGYMLTGGLTAVISGRVSYTLGLEGPAVTVDTACSSSSVALHLASQALRVGECSMALVGGVAVMSTPGAFADFSEQQGMASNGRCKAFSADADGIGWAEGAGVVLVERLSDARRNGHPVLAVIKGSAANQDGASNGLTAPNGPSQQRVIRSALTNARLSTADVDMVEGHGTGTVLGDPIEAQALIETYGQDRPEGRPLWLASVKSNIGHAQAASGVISVIKTVLALQHELLPQTLHAEEPSPHIDWSAGDVRLLNEPLAWPATEGRPRRAGVSSFGVSGTNVHIILEEAPAADAAATDEDAAGADDDAAETTENAENKDTASGGATATEPVTPQVLSGSDVAAYLVSGRSGESLAAQAGRLRDFVLAHPESKPADLAWSLATTRSTFEYRAVVTGADHETLAAGLAAVATGQPDAGVVSGSVPGSGLGRSVFVFPGQGSQWVGMGRELLATSPVFAAKFAQCAEALAPYIEWSLHDVISGAEGAPALEAAEVVQPVLWAMMVSLAAVWQAAGVTPDAVVGHSQGEIAAACVAGILSIQDAARVVALRSQALKAIAGQGGMLSIAEPADRVRERLAEYGDRVSVAAINGPSATVVSGEPEALQAIAAACEAGNVRARMVPVDYASHCAQIEALRTEILRVLDGITPHEAAIPMISAMSGAMLAGPEMGPDYWYASLRSPVEFERAVRTLAEGGYQVYVEVSPHPVLTGPVGDTVEQAGGTAAVVTGTLRRDEGGPARLLTSLAEAHVRGVRVDWTTVLDQGARIDLPTYAFQRVRFWPKPISPADAAAAQGSGSEAEARFWAAVEAGNLRELAEELSVDDARLGDLLPALSDWRRRERTESVLDSWRYRVSWIPVTDVRGSALSGTWLVVVPAGRADDPTVQESVRALTEHGADAAVIELDSTAPDRAVYAGHLASALTEAGATSAAGVLSLLALDEEPLPDYPNIVGGVAATMLLTQALGDAAIVAPLWAVTSNAVATGVAGEAINLKQAQIWGLGRVAGLEHPDRWGGLIDLPSQEAQWDDRVAAQFCAVLSDGGEDQVALRSVGILARRLIRAANRPAPAERWTPRGTVLVTGGTGEIGPFLVRWLAEGAAEQVVLTSRSGVPSGIGAAVAPIAEAGTTVRFVACDIASRDQVAGLLDRIAADGPPLKSVFHAANAVDLTMLDDTGLPDLDKAMGAKVSGAARLDELTAGLDLDAFVLFSSIAATWGSSEHATYAAANAYLDALAVDRRARGLTATTVAWGVWNTRGDISGLEDAPLDPSSGLTPARLLRQGFTFLDPRRGLAALDRALADDETFLAVADIDWTKYAPVYTALRPWRLLDGIPEVRQLSAGETAGSGSATPAATGELAQRLAGLAPDEQERLVLDLVRTQAAAVLGHGSAEQVPAGRAFRDLGFDSLTAVDLRNRLNNATGLKLPSTAVFDYPSSTVLAREVVRQLLGSSQASATPAPAVLLDPAEPIAIVGMGCRFPGEVASPEQLWDLVVRGGDAISGFPADRNWDVTGLFDPDPDNPGTSYVQEGGFLHGVAEFDADFFGISPREALAMDPQQRLLLETSWEALERAGIDPDTLQGSLTGVFVGAAPSGYASQAVQVEGIEGHLITGNIISVLSGRISYTLGLEGPAVTVDTACSSGLVALHLAAQALRGGECTMALAGGVMVMTDPSEFVGFSRQRVLASDGRCKAFGAGADGMGIAEGAGMVLLERLSDAQRNGHKVLALVRGSATNQDGASNGLTAPNGPSQQRVIRAALANAQLSASEVDAIEAHGTGTALGDPIEAQALMATYGQDRPEDRPLWLGSVKSNIGHAQQAAGVAGLIKMVEALQRGLLPPTLYADEPSPFVDWSAGDVKLLTEAVAWPAVADRPRRAGVSAFGLSGTNAHVILEEAPAAPDTAETDGDEPQSADPATPVFSATDSGADASDVNRISAWLVSGRTADALAAQAGRLREFALAHPGLAPADIAWSLATSRSVFEHRAVVVGTGREALTASLAAVATGQSAPGAVSGRAHGAARVGFLFSGQGSQRAGMGRELYEASPVFAAAFDQVTAFLEADLGLPVADVVLGRAGSAGYDADQTVFAQTGLFALQIGLMAVLKAAGVKPDAVAGHSVGEIAAAHAAGVLSLLDAARLVSARAKLMQSLPEGGSMWAIAVTEAEITASLEGVDGVSIAAVNGPDSIVISGDAEATARIAETWRESGRRVRQLRVSHAFHSERMDPILDELGSVAQDLTYAEPTLPWAQAVQGAVAATCDGGYWPAQARGAVRYADAVNALVGEGISVFIEVGPDGTLSALGAGAVSENSDTAFVPVLRKDEPGPIALLSGLAGAFVRGARVDWTALLSRGEQVDLPTYAFQHQHYWPQIARREAAPAGGEGAGSKAETAFWAAVENGDVEQLADALAVDDERLGELLPALASWRRRERADSAVADWRYRVTWTAVVEPRSAALTGTWLAVTSAAHAENARVQEGIQALIERGATIVTLEIGPEHLDRAQLATSLAQIVEGLEAEQFVGVVSWLALDESPAPQVPAVPTGVAGTLVLVQALGDAGIAAPLWAVTQGAVSTGRGDKLTSAVQAQIWGLGRVVALEHPERWGGLVDLPQAWDERIAARLAAVLAAGVQGDRAEDQVALRPAGLLARRLERAPQPSNSGRWEPRGTVLVTGGTGGIGGRVAGWAAERGAPRVVLTSRSGPGASGAAALAAQVAAVGTQVQVVACDVTQRAEVEGLLGRIAADGPPLSSVVHSAGLGEATPIQDFTLQRLSDVSEVKTAGVTWLDELTSDIDLDAFVVFSSVSATWGSGLQPGYAAANAHLDAVAEQRRSRGQAATSVAWGLWGGGMGGGAAGEALQRYGLKIMDPDLGTRALALAVDAGETAVTVADVDWDRFAPLFTVRRSSPLISSLPEVERALTAQTGPAAVASDGELSRRLRGLSPVEQQRLLVDLVRTEAASVLGHGSPDAVDPARAFSDLGFDSLTAVELRTKLGAATGLRLPATLVFDYPTTRILADHLLGELLGVQSGGADASAATGPVDDEPIAIVSMSCRLPGGADDPELLWDLVAGGKDAIASFPNDRGWEALEQAYHASRSGSGDGAAASIARVGGFVYDAPEFDAGFFGISPREALAMDPQQRLLLETAWEAVERAGIDPHSLRGSRTGVFAGASNAGYGAGPISADPGSEGYQLTGGLTAVISGRVSYSLGLEGPAVTVDTACSSSLVALHLACQSLHAGECNMALAGGVTVMATPGAFAEFSKQQGMATNGRCKAFSADADGIGWAEGSSVLLIERLSDAQRNGHPVLAIIKGSAMNQDGASNGLTAPNGPSQQRVIRSALANAGLTTADVDAIEGHGTGTSLGDPIEAGALIATYGQDRPEGRPLWLGSVKSNIGHSQAASGAAGVIKMVLALQHSTLPRTLHVEQPSPHIDWSAGDVKLLAEDVAWPATEGRPRRAGVSSFGISGTNAHVIIEEAPAADTASQDTEPADESIPAAVATPANPVLSGTQVPAWLVSGRTADALAAQAGRLREFTLAHPGLDPAGVAWSLATSRSTFEHRAVVVGADRQTLIAGLAAVSTGQPAPGVTIGGLVPGDVGRAVFVFPGQGSQWAGMGRELLATSPVFAARFAECAAALSSYVEWSLHDVISGAEGAPALEAAEIVQPVLWAMMVSLAAVWQAAGVTPDAVVGHSQGEIAAACVAGILSIQDAARVVALRSQALKAIAGQGGMLSIAEPSDQVRERLAEYGDRVSVAAVNGPSATVVSGELEALQGIIAACEAEGVRARMVPVDYASHCAQIDSLQAEILRVLDGVSPNPARIPMISAMSGEMLTGSEMDASYWYASLRSPVEFDRAISTLAQNGYQVFIEVSPHPVLTGPVGDSVEQAGGTVAVVTGTLRRDEGGPARLLTSLAEAHVGGVHVDWTAVLDPADRVDLPTYTFQHQRYWPQISVPEPAAPTGEGSGSKAEARFWAAVEAGDVDQVAGDLAVEDRQPLDALLPALASWHKREQQDSVLDGWRYRVSWVPVTDARASALAGAWLVIVPAGTAQDATTADCVRTLTEYAAEVTLVEVGPEYIDPFDRTALADLLTGQLGGAQAVGVVSLLGLDESTVEDQPAVHRAVSGTLLLVQALGDAGITAPLWAVTRGAVGAGLGEAPTSPVQALVWGLGRVVGLEHPDRWGGLIDLPQEWDERTTTRFCAVLAGSAKDHWGEDQLALRPSGILARRLVRAAVRPARAERWTSRGTVLVTGGTGEIGPHLVRWLSEAGAEQVVLTSRSGASNGVGAALASIVGVDTAVRFVACDVAKPDQLGGLLDRIAADGPPLKAVFHAANAVDLTMLDATAMPELSKALGAKVAGAICLDALTSGLDLDAFVMFSSITATWGSSEHGAYAAANSYLDALAAHRRARGLPATSVAWGVWDTRDWAAIQAEAARTGVDLTPISVTRERIERQGLSFLDPGRGLAALGRALADDETSISIADVDWTRFAPIYTALRPWRLLDQIPEVRRLSAPDAPGATGPAAASAGDLKARLAGMLPAERERAVVDLVSAQAAAVLGHSSADQVPAGQAFRDLGFDSLTAVDLRNRLNGATGLKLPSTAVFDYPTPAALAEYVLGELGGSAQADLEPVLDELERLASALSADPRDEDRRRALAQRLEALTRVVRGPSAGAAAPLPELDEAPDDEMFDLVDEVLNSPDFE